jgi:hypothetical protein
MDANGGHKGHRPSEPKTAKMTLFGRKRHGDRLGAYWARFCKIALDGVAGLLESGRPPVPAGFPGATNFADLFCLCKSVLLAGNAAKLS